MGTGCQIVGSRSGSGQISDFCWRAGNRALGFAALLVGGAVVEDARKVEDACDARQPLELGAPLERGGGREVGQA